MGYTTGTVCVCDTYLYCYAIPSSLISSSPLPSPLALLSLSLQACKEREVGVVDIDTEAEERREELYVPSWFSCDIKTGVSCKILSLYSSLFFLPLSLCRCYLLN